MIAGCANQMTPGGGDIDKTPPQIIESFPLNGTVNYDKNYFEIVFSEYVVKSSVQNSVFISPALEKPLEYDWSGKSLTVYFSDTLKKNTTYTISIGTDVQDINNSNKMAEAYTFAFSTGNKIDKGRISGRIYDQNSEGLMIFCYRESGKEIDPSNQKPDYISQSGKNGKYSLLGLGEGSYKVFPINDKQRNSKYQKNQDEFGVQFKDIVLDEKFNEAINVDFFLTKEDTIAPQISNVIMKNRNNFIVEFMDVIDSLSTGASNFYLYDSLSGKKILPGYFFKGDAKPLQYYLGFADSLDPGGNWILTSSGIPDPAANISGEEKNKITVKNERDTVSLKILRAEGELPAGKVDFEKAELNLRLNKGLDSVNLKRRLTIEDSKGEKFTYKIKRVDDAFYKISVVPALKQSTEYKLNLDLRNYTDYCGNRVDSLFQSKFTTSNELDFSGAAGDVSVLSDTSDVIVVLQNASDRKLKYSQKTGTKKNFDFKKVIPGKYIVWGFKDENRNNKYDQGQIIPFKLSEEFKYYPDTLNLRARWPVGGISLQFEK